MPRQESNLCTWLGNRSTALRKYSPMPLPPLSLQPLLAEVRARSTGIDSRIHGELHWRTVGANGLWLAESIGAATRA